MDARELDVEQGSHRNYVLTAASGRFHLRIYGRASSIPTVAYELELLAALGDRGVRVCPPVRRRDGRLFGEVAPDGAGLYAVFAYARGTPPVWTAETAHRFGDLVARVHLTADAVAPAREGRELDLDALVTLPTRTLLAGGPDAASSAALASAATEIGSVLAELPRRRPLWGVIHADLHGANVHADDAGELRLFDFASCAVGPRAYDLALCWLAVEPTNWGAFVNGYAGVRRPEAPEICAIRALAKARMVSDCASSVRDPGGRPGGFWTYERLRTILGKIDALPDPGVRLASEE